MTPRLQLLAAAALAALHATALAQGRATVQVLHTAADTMSSTALGLNDLGQVVGSMTGTGPSQAVLWNPGSNVRVLMGPGTDGAQARAINRHGVVTGSYQLNHLSHTYAWSDARGTTQLLTPNGDGARPVAINSQGVVAGSWFQYAVSSPVLWSAATGAMQELTPRGDLRGLNDLGQAVGTEGGAGVPRLWQADGSSALLAGAGRPNDINNAGQVVGTLGGHGYLWEPGRGVVGMRQAGWSGSDANAVNDAGQAVGRGTLNSGAAVAVLWRDGFGMSNLGALGGTGFTATSANDINIHAQVAGSGTTASGQQRAYLMTLHPDWRGGDGQWDDSTGQRWNWAGTGTAAARVGAMHDVVIDPGRTATVWGSAQGSARTLRIGGTAGHAATLDLNGGTTQLGDGDVALYNPSVVASGGVLRGNGRLEVREDLSVQAGGRVLAGAGQFMQLSVDYLDNRGLIRAQGTAAQQARLEIGGGALYNQAGGQIQAVHGDVVFDNALVNFGQVSLQASQLTMARPGVAGQLYNGAGAMLAVSFGDSVITGRIDNRGLVVVSNGARASFHGEVNNTQELRVSAGGAANFFGDVVSSGHVTGDGEVRFEGAFSTGAPQGVQIDPDVTFAGDVRMLLEGDADRTHFSFARGVTLSGATLAVSWDDSSVAAAGMVIDLFDWNGGLTGTFTRVALPTLADGLVWNTADLYLGGSLAIAPVPEPGSWALFVAGLAALRLRRARC